MLRHEIIGYPEQKALWRTVASRSIFEFSGFIILGFFEYFSFKHVENVIQLYSNFHALIHNNIFTIFLFVN